MIPPLFFYWGQPRMSFLRWLTLVSAAQVHGNVVLVTRRDPVAPDVTWDERQDFQNPHMHTIPIDAAVAALNAPNVSIEYLEDLAPQVAELRADDVHTKDLLAWWLLGTQPDGCTVADMDIVFLWALPAITEDVMVCRFTGTPKPGYAPVTFMQGRPCKVWSDAYIEAMRCYDPAVYESCGAAYIPTDQPAHLSEQIVFPWAGLPFHQYEEWLFTATDWPEIPRLGCVGIHWYAGLNQGWNERIHALADFRGGAMAWAARRVLGAPEPIEVWR
jgi:hypothetical protein